METFDKVLSQVRTENQIAGASRMDEAQEQSEAHGGHKRASRCRGAHKVRERP